VATIRDGGLAPCTNDTVLAEDFDHLGTPQDMAARVMLARVDVAGVAEDIEAARDLIFKRGYAVNYSSKENVLKGRSLVPTRVRVCSLLLAAGYLIAGNQNVFAPLHSWGVNYYRMLMTDVLHEFKLGLWKMIFIHLIRLLLALGMATLLLRLNNA
jgi:hypothetical protein